MKRSTAENIIRAMRKIDEVLEELGCLSHEIDDEFERKELRREIADLIHQSHIGITLNVVQQYPDLHPDKK
jgi:hypothetical protein